MGKTEGIFLNLNVFKNLIGSPLMLVRYLIPTILSIPECGSILDIRHFRRKFAQDI